MVIRLSVTVPKRIYDEIEERRIKENISRSKLTSDLLASALMGRD